MKTTNIHEGKQLSLKEKFLRNAGDKLVQMAASPRCMGVVIYEPNLSTEMIQEMLDEQ